MTKILKLTALVLALATGSAMAAPPIVLGSGPGEYFFSNTKDSAFTVELTSGTYSFTVDVGTEPPLQLTEVWLSYGTDKNPNGKNDIGTYTPDGAGGFVGTITASTTGLNQPIYLLADTQFGNHSGAAFSGSLEVTAVPEPAISSLMLAGLGLLYLMGRRRNWS
jgi:hypothetical protein